MDLVQGLIARTHHHTLRERMQSRVAARYSCRTWRARGHRRALVAFLLTVLAVALLTLSPEIVVPAALMLAFATMAIATVTKSAASLAHLLHRPPPAAPPLTEAQLPTISILVPLYRERRIAEVLVRRLQAITYPREKLDILLVLEEEDHLTQQVLRATDLPPWIRTLTVPDGQPRTKPRAMNYALDHCTGEIIGVYDAEDAPAPDQLLRVANAFAESPPDVVCLQGVLDYYNPRTNWISRCFTIEYNTWFRLLLPGMARLGLALPLGGTTLFFRRDPLEDLGGWDAHNVTEDADLGFRLARAGYRTRALDTTTEEEANDRPIPWIRQRSRWLKGYMVTYLVHMRDPHRLWNDLGTWQFLGFQAHFLTAMAQFALGPLLWLFWLATLGIDLPFTTLDTSRMMQALSLIFIAQELLTMALGAIAVQRAGHRRLWLWVPVLHLYWPLGTIAMWKALYELIVQPFYWDKTDHGHSLPDYEATVPIVPESIFSRVTKAREI